MATTKKPAAKKPVKKTAAKSTAAKRAPAKSRATSVRVKKAQPMQSFKPAKSSEPFLTVRITHQTVYWAILAIIVLALGLWVIDINDRVMTIYDQIDASSAAVDETLVTPSAKTDTPQ